MAANNNPRETTHTASGLTNLIYFDMENELYELIYENFRLLNGFCFWTLILPRTVLIVIVKMKVLGETKGAVAEPSNILFC